MEHLLPGYYFGLISFLFFRNGPESFSRTIHNINYPPAIATYYDIFEDIVRGKVIVEED